MSKWQTLPVRRLFTIVNGGTPSADNANWGGDVPWATPVDLAKVNGDVLTTTDRTLTESGLRAGSRAVPAGSLVLSTRAPIGYVAECTVRTAFNQGCRGLSPSVPMILRYFRYQFASLTEPLQSWGQGSTFTELSGDALAAFPLVVPPLATQRVVADYLDRETVRIDALIAAKQRMVELSKERYWSDVTHRLEQQAKSFLPLRRFITRITDGPFGSALTSSDYSNAGARVVRLGNIGRGYFRTEDEAFISPEYFQSLLRHRVLPGNLLIAGLGDANNPVGRACVAPDLGPAIVKADCYCALVNPERSSPDFLALYLSSPLGAKSVAMAARGTTRSRINLDIAREIEVPLVSLAVQDEITAAATAQRRSCEVLSQKLQTQIRLLQERRQSLITSAVIGQFDIMEAA